MTPLSAVAPRAEEAQWGEGPVFLERSTVTVLDGSPRQPVLVLAGVLPTPCHALRIVLTPPQADGRIAFRAYSVADPHRMCAQMAAPLNVTVALGAFTI